MIIYIDDILVTGPTDEEHLASLEEVLHRIESAELPLKRKRVCLWQSQWSFVNIRLMHKYCAQCQRTFELCKRQECVRVEVVSATSDVLFLFLARYGSCLELSLQPVE